MWATKRPTGSNYQRSKNKYQYNYVGHWSKLEKNPPLEEWRLYRLSTALPRSAPPSFPHPPLGVEAFCHQNPLSEFNFYGFGTFSPNKISDWLETLLGNDYRALLWTGDGTADRCVLLLLLLLVRYDAKTASGLCPLSAPPALPPSATLPMLLCWFLTSLCLNC